jgi:hypothetical protein
MKWSGRICLFVLAPALVWAQTGTDNHESPGVASELEKLRQAVSQQQEQMARQQQQMAEQLEQMGQQQRQIEALQKALIEKETGAPRIAEASLHTTVPATKANVAQGDQKPKESPLSFRIGGTEFTPGGFVDFENVFRTTNTGNNISTSFQAIPFSNVVAGHLTEFRTTGQYSRYNLKITGTYGANNVTGYLEGDFNGNNATNVYTSTNPNTNRLRLYWVDLRRGNWEFLGGQTWGLVTPNRVGLSPLPADLAITINEDANIQVGIPYTRAGEFRTIYHFSDTFQWGVAVENPEQYAIGVSFPAAFAEQLTGQFNPQNASNGTPNTAPDIWTKAAWDGNPGGAHQHFEVGGVTTFAKTTVIPTVPGANFVQFTKPGYGLLAGTVLSFSKNLRFLGNALAGQGIGRYMIGMGPQAVVVPINTAGGICGVVGKAAANCSVSIAAVKAATGLGGIEWQPTPNTILAGYYGFGYFQRLTAIDVTSPTVLTTAVACAPGFPLTTHPCVGYGGFNSASTNNRYIQEPTIDLSQTFWRNPQYGAVTLLLQASWVNRTPWFVATTPTPAPRNAHLAMGWLSLRYILP